MLHYLKNLLNKGKTSLRKFLNKIDATRKHEDKKKKRFQIKKKRKKEEEIIHKRK